MNVDTSVFARIIKQEKQADGTLLVTGIATDDTLDIDEQICDPDWLERAMPAWFKYGNIREQHSNIAAGVATKYKQYGSQHIITAHIVDKNSIAKLDLKVLKGFSIGIRNPRIAHDKAAPGGRIVDGQIVEVSLVDRPANPSCLLELAKSVGGIMQQTETLIEKDAAMERCDKCGKAFKSDELDEKMMCEDCKAATEESTESTEASAEGTTEESAVMAAEESTETTEAKAEETAAGDEESTEAKAPEEESSQKIGEESSQVMGEESSREGGIAGVAGKEEMSEHVEEEMATLAQLSETVARIEAMLSEYVKSKADDSTEEVSKSVKAIDERLAKVEKSASRGPVRTVTKAVPSVDASAVKAAKAADYRAKAAATTDPALAEGYLLLAGEAENN